MIPHRISAKLFIDNPEAVDIPAIIPVFHRWVTDSPVPGLLIDVADYKHIYHGPGVVLIGHQGDYALDLRDGAPGLQYTGKRGWQKSDDLPSRLRVVLKNLAAAREALACEQQPDSRLIFDDSSVEIRLVDNLRAPNSPSTFAAVVTDVRSALAQVYPDRTVELDHAAADAGAPFTVRVKLR